MVRVSKKGDFAHFGGCIYETKRARISLFVTFDRSHRDLWLANFYYNRSVNTARRRGGQTEKL